MVNKIKIVQLWRQVVCSVLALLTLLLMGCNKSNQLGMHQAKNRQENTIITAEGVNLIEVGTDSIDNTQNSRGETEYRAQWTKWLNKLPSLGTCIKWIIAGGTVVAVYLAGGSYLHSNTNSSSRNTRSIGGFDCVRDGRGFLNVGLDFHGYNHKVLDALSIQYVDFPSKCSNATGLTKSERQTCMNTCVSSLSNFCTLYNRYETLFQKNLKDTPTSSYASGPLSAVNEIIQNFSLDRKRLADELEKIIPKELLICNDHVNDSRMCKERNFKQDLKLLVEGTGLLELAAHARQLSSTEATIQCLQDEINNLKRTNNNSSLERQLQTVKWNASQNEEKLTASIRDIQSLRARLGSSNITFDELTEIINERSRNTSVAFSEIAVLRSNVSNLASELKNFKSEVSKNFTHVNSRLDQHDTDITKLTSRVEDLEKKNNTALGDGVNAALYFYQQKYINCTDDLKNVTETSISRNEIEENNKKYKDYMPCSCSPEWKDTLPYSLSNQECDDNYDITLRCTFVTENNMKSIDEDIQKAYQAVHNFNNSSVKPVEEPTSLFTQQNSMDYKSELKLWIEENKNCEENLEERRVLQESRRIIKEKVGKKLNPCLCTHEWEYTYDPSSRSWCSENKKEIIKLTCKKREHGFLEKNCRWCNTAVDGIGGFFKKIFG